MYKKNLLIFALIFVTIFGFLGIKNTHAIYPDVFGGMVMGVVECTCSCGRSIYVSPPREGIIHICSGRGYAYRWMNPFVGDWVLGRHDNTHGYCSVWVDKTCIPYPYDAEMIIMGSSGSRTLQDTLRETAPLYKKGHTMYPTWLVEPSLYSTKPLYFVGHNINKSWSNIDTSANNVNLDGLGSPGNLLSE